MKYKIMCKSPLLQYTLEYFLKDYINENGIIITDNPDIEGILIGKDIKKPFTKTSLFLELEKIIPKTKKTLEEKLDIAFDKFKKELLEILKEHYGEK